MAEWSKALASGSFGNSLVGNGVGSNPTDITTFLLALCTLFLLVRKEIYMASLVSDRLRRLSWVKLNCRQWLDQLHSPRGPRGGSKSRWDVWIYNVVVCIEVRVSLC